MYGGSHSASPPLTNNPFLSDPTHPSIRFPDISTPPANLSQQQQYASYGDGTVMGSGGGYSQPPQQQLGTNMQMQYPQSQAPLAQPQQQQMIMGGGVGSNSGFLPTAPQSYSSQSQTVQSAPFQPSSSFGQNLAAHISGTSYNYLQGQQQQQSNPNSYHPAQQQLKTNPGYIAQFDPYSSLGQVWDGSGNTSPMAQNFSTGSTTSSSSISASPSVSTTGSTYGVSATGDPHPRDYIRTHKSEIEAWDTYAWKQLLSTFEALMRAWETRKIDLTRSAEQLTAQLSSGMAYGGFYVSQIQQEGSRLQALHKEAKANFDSVAASNFQMKEVFEGYRQSSDLAGKRRVKEATNAALQVLPGWPQPY